MAFQIIRQYGLVALRVRVQPVERGVKVRLQLVSHIGGTEQEVASWWLGSTDLHLPTRLTAQWPPTRQLPDAVLAEIGASLQALGLAESLPLWLHLVKPYGWLGALDWESALAPLGWPVLRVPDFFEQPRENREVLDVAVVCSEPVSEPRLNPPQVLEDIVHSVLQGSTRPRTTIHVFPDLRYHAQLSMRFASEPRVAVHDPEGARAHGEQRRSSLGDDCAELRSPWLKWMRDSMKGRSLDAVHFVCHGYVADQRPAISLAESPLFNGDWRDARYVGVAELASFLTQTGAWSAIFSSPPSNYSEAGLRLLADSIAQARPGPVMFHTLAAPGLDPLLAQAYGFLYARQPSAAPSGAGWFAYCQPEIVVGLQRPDAGSRRYGSALDANRTLLEQGVPARKGKRGGAAATAAAPAASWVSAAQRYVEQQTLQLQRQPGEDDATGAAVNAEIERTLAQLQAIVGRVAAGGQP